MSIRVLAKLGQCIRDVVVPTFFITPTAARSSLHQKTRLQRVRPGTDHQKWPACGPPSSQEDHQYHPKPSSSSMPQMLPRAFNTHAAEWLAQTQIQLDAVPTLEQSHVAQTSFLQGVEPTASAKALQWIFWQRLRHPAQFSHFL